MEEHLMSRDDIAARVRELGEWFHNMELGGIQTAPSHFLGDYPNVKWQRFKHAVPRNLEGRSVLDVGCNAGFYSIAMKERGASRVVGVDSDEGYLQQARFAAEVRGADIEFRRMSVYELGQLREKFDLVIFMGVLYHLRHPLLALDILRRHVVGGTLLFQSMLRGSTDVTPLASDYPFSETEVFDQPNYPKMHFVEQRYSNDPTNWWIPNRACAEAMLRSAGFDIVSHPESEVYVCVAREGFSLADGELP
ncbi:MAG: TIGR04290 family methyltransferase [Myxococcota bacterium]|nr:TIGR04290 family methyltransferase [Myxococcota bacterium]